MMGLLERLKSDNGNQSLESDKAHDILEKLESTKELLSPRRVIFASATVLSLFLVSIFTVIWVVPYDRVSVDVVYRQGTSGHIVLAQLDNQGSREISDITISIRFTDSNSIELGRTDHFIDSLIAWGDLEKVRKELLQKFSNNVHLIKGNSNKLLCKIDMSKIDYVFLDGGHDYDTVKNDLNCSIEVINNNGTILCDDYDLSYAPGVKKAIDEFSLTNKFNCSIICN